MKKIFKIVILGAIMCLLHLLLLAVVRRIILLEGGLKVRHLRVQRLKQVC